MAYKFLSTILGIDANFTGNLGVGTTTPGAKLDVNGTTRSQGKLTITTGGAEITGNVVAYTGIQSYGQVQIFSAAAFQMFNGANNSKASFQYINANGLLLTTNSDNISGVLKGLQINPTMVASANNDVLVGLDITPTFTNGAFTGLTNLGLRVNAGSVAFGQNSTPSTLYINGGLGGTTPLDIYLANFYGTSTINTGFGTGTKQWILLGRGSLPQTSAIAGINLGNNQYESGLLFATASGGVFSEKMRIWNTGNVTINSTTDAGYKLDVNGTARVITSLQVGNFTPGVAGAASTILTQGRISASGGITFYNPAAGDNQDLGFKAGGNGVGIYINNGIIGSFGGYGASLNPLFNLSSGFNASSGTGNKTVFTLTPTYQTSGTFSGGITGILYSPSLASLTGVTYHRAIETVSGDVILGSTSGNVGIGTTTLGTATRLTLGGSQTASSAIARGGLVNTTLVAAANNDVLVGLDVAPTFTNGAFTGVINYGIRTSGDIAFASAANRYLTMQSPSTSGSGGNIIIQGGSANTSGTGGNVYLYVGSGVGGPGPGKIYIGNNNGWDVAYVTGILTVSSSGPNTGDVFRVNGGGRNALTISWDNVTPFMSYGLVSGRQSRFLNSSSYYFDNNLLVGITTNAGYKLDINGTARVSGTTTLSTLAGTGSRMVVADSTGTLSTQAIPGGGSANGSWQENSTQTAPANNTGVGVKFSTLNFRTGVNVIPDSGGQPTLIQMVAAGRYDIQFSFQFENADNAAELVYVWLRKNGENTPDDIPDSNTMISVPAKHGSTPGKCVAAWNFFVEAAPGDFFQLAWATADATNVSMPYYAATGFCPATPSTILTVNQVD
jgi:hypothetical protein